MTQDSKIVVKCPDCDEARVGIEDVMLRHCIDDERWSYRFTCPICRRPSGAATREPAALEAVAAGCKVESWRLPAELLEHHEGPPLTQLDLFELQRLLLEPDWFDSLVRASQGH